MEEVPGSTVEGRKDGIIYKIADIQDFGIALKLFREEFRKREPIFSCSRSGLEDDNIELESPDFISSFITEPLKGGLSLVAIDASTGQTVGLRMSRICTKHEKEEKKKSTNAPRALERKNKLQNILAYIDDLKDVNYFEKYGVDRMFEFVFLVVKESHSGRGIAKELLTRSLKLGKQQGLEAAVVIATHAITIDLFPKLGFETLREVAIENYLIGGEKAFPHASKGQFGRLYGKKL